MLNEKWRGELPRAMASLLELPGVARKTANVVLGTAFGIAEGVVVDTHVTRLSQRLGLTRESTAERIERDLMEIVPRPRWILSPIRLSGTAVVSAMPANPIAMGARWPLTVPAHLARYESIATVRPIG